MLRADIEKSLLGALNAARSLRGEVPVLCGRVDAIRTELSRGE